MLRDLFIAVGVAVGGIVALVLWGVLELRRGRLSADEFAPYDVEQVFEE